MQNFNNLLEFIAQWIVGVLLGLLACALLTLLFGCSTPQPVVVERVVVKTVHSIRRGRVPTRFGCTTRCMLNTTLVATQCIG